MCKIAIIVSSLKVGGAERVASILANHVVSKTNHEAHLILLTKNPRFYQVVPEVKIFEPSFRVADKNRLVSLFYTLKHVRSALKSVKPQVVLSFGGKYNSFNIISSFQICDRIFITDRSRPGISYGAFVDLLNLFLYRYAAGIIVQTSRARRYFRNKYSKTKAFVIPNPFIQPNLNGNPRNRIILNVGRFIRSKNQEELIDIFIRLNPMGWKLHFVGSGPELEYCKDKVSKAGFTKSIIFWGTRKDVNDFYLKSEIFAFTSTSEGFPNALGEALAAGCACLSYDICAGPSDLIENGVNGFLVEKSNQEKYLERLTTLIHNADLRSTMGRNAIKKMTQFSEREVIHKYLNILCNS